MSLSPIDNIRWLLEILVPLSFSSYALYTSFQFRKYLSLGEQIANIPSLLNDIYIYGKFPIKVDGPNNKELKTFREARNYINQKLNTAIDFDKALNEIHEKTLNVEHWENKFAYHVSISLNQIGLLILTGAIPLRLIMPTIAGMIVRDWMICQKLVKEKIRSESSLVFKNKKGYEPIHIERRYAEWLAYAAAVYLYSYWEGPYLKKYIKHVGDEKKVMKREKEIRDGEPWIIPNNIKKEINKILYDP